MPTISLITATLNAADTLPDCLTSVRLQGDVEFEHRIIDGGSGDGTLTVLDTWRDYPLAISSGRDRGLYDAMNKGVQRAQGDVVGILNADDYYADTRVLARVAQAFLDPEIDACYGDLVYVRVPPNRGSRRGQSAQTPENGGSQVCGLMSTAALAARPGTDAPGPASGCLFPRASASPREDALPVLPNEPKSPSTASSPAACLDRGRRHEPARASGTNLRSPISDLPSAVSESRLAANAFGLPADDDAPSCLSLPGEQVTRVWKAGSPGDFRWGWMPPHPTFFVRREIYRELGGFRLDLGSAADYEFMLRVLVKHRRRAVYLPGVMVKMRSGGVSNSSLRNRWLANRMDRQAWKVNGLRPYPWTLLAKPLRKIGQWRMRPGAGS